MTDPGEGRRISGLVGGALLLSVGTLLVLQNFGIVRVGSLSDYWPLFLVWAGATRLLGPQRRGHLVSGVVLLALGAFFLLERFGWVGVSLSELWPVFLVAAGAAMILEGLRGRRAGEPVGSSPRGESEFRS